MRVPLDRWDQFGGNLGGSGFRAVNSVAPVWPPAQSIPLPSNILDSSPVIAPNGLVVVGTNDGHLFACRPRSGFPPFDDLRRETRIAEHHFSVRTPAVAEDGTVYCLCTAPHVPQDPRDHRTPSATNLLVSVNANGTVRWTFPIPPQRGDFDWCTGFVRGAPRLLSRGSEARIVFVVDYIVTVRYPEVQGHGPLYARHLVILDEAGGVRLFHRYHEERLFIEAHGGGGWPGSAVLGDPPEIPGPKLPPGVHPYADTPVVLGNLASAEPWTIALSGRSELSQPSGFYIFRWHDREAMLVAQPGFVAPLPATSLSAFPNGLLSVSSRGSLSLFDAETLARHAPHSITVGAEAMAAGGLRHIYCLARRGVLTAVDSNGAAWKTR
ncbi:MAG: hypothetical protein K0S81_2685, partial [Rhodospirillales bacterium]|nr:hypothetical protein [Rhodospirillales bacterium]